MLHALLVVPLGLSQHVTGIGITLLATSLAYYIYRLVLPEVTSPPKIVPFSPISPRIFTDSAFISEIFRQTPLTYLAFAMVVAVAWFLYRTPAGLALRTAGENPQEPRMQRDYMRMAAGAWGENWVRKSLELDGIDDTVQAPARPDVRPRK